MLLFDIALSLSSLSLGVSIGLKSANESIKTWKRRYEEATKALRINEGLEDSETPKEWALKIDYRPISGGGRIWGDLYAVRGDQRVLLLTVKDPNSHRHEWQRKQRDGAKMVSDMNLNTEVSL